MKRLDDQKKLDLLWCLSHTNVDAESAALIKKKIEAGDHPDTLDDINGNSLLYLAIKTPGDNARKIVQALCKHGANPLLDGLVDFAASEYMTIVDLLIEASVKNQYRDHAGGCVMHGMANWAFHGADDEWLGSLLFLALRNGARVDVLDKKGVSALEKLWRINYRKAKINPEHVAEGQWRLTDLLFQEGLIDDQIERPEILSLIQKSGFGPHEEFHPSQITRRPVMDHVMTLIDHIKISTDTPHARKYSAPRRV